jgi:hypothetical protein
MSAARDVDRRNGGGVQRGAGSSLTRQRGGEVVGGRYRLTGDVTVLADPRGHRARDLRSGSTVRVTSISLGEEESRAAAFLAQAARLVELSACHDRVARILDYGCTDGVGFIVVEVPKGERLRERVRRDRPLDVGTCIRFGIQIAGVLEAVHLRGAAHGHLRAGDIILLGKNVKVGGFERRVIKLHASEAGRGWPAADNAADKPAAGQQADVTALASLLYWMIASVHPAKGPGQIVPLKRLRDDVPASVGRMVMELLEGRPGGPQVLADVMDVLLHAAMHHNRRGLRGRMGRLGAWPVPMAVLTGTVGAVVIGVVLWSSPRLGRSSPERAPDADTLDARVGASASPFSTTDWTSLPTTGSAESAPGSDSPDVSEPIAKSDPRGLEDDRREAHEAALTAGGGTVPESGLQTPKEPEPPVTPQAVPAPRTTTQQKAVSRRGKSIENWMPPFAPPRSGRESGARAVIALPPLPPMPLSTPRASKATIAAPKKDQPEPTAIIDWLLPEGVSRPQSRTE